MICAHTVADFTAVSTLPKEGIDTFIVPEPVGVMVRVLEVPLPDMAPLVALPVPLVMVMFVAAKAPGSALNVKVSDVVIADDDPLAVTE